MDGLSTLALALGAAWASGINLYATVLLIGGLGATGAVNLPSDLEVLETLPVLATAAGLYALEFLADKVPGIDTLNDILHTFIRIPAGAMLAAGSVADISEPWQTAAALAVGGVVAAGSHAAKAGSRAIINTSPEPFSNIAASIFEDVLVICGVLLALFKPVAFLFMLGLFALMVVWLLPKIWRGLNALYRRLQELFGHPATATGAGPPAGIGPTPDPDPPAGRP